MCACSVWPSCSGRLSRTEAELTVDLPLDVRPRKLQTSAGGAAALRFQPLHHAAERDRAKVRCLQRLIMHNIAFLKG